MGMTKRRIQQLAIEGRIGERLDGKGTFVFFEDEIKEFKKLDRPVGNPNFGA